MRAAIYARVSTRNGQATENQVRELRSVAERSGWDVVRVFEDKGISGAKGRDKRPQMDELLKAVTRREIDIVLAWSVDRLGRSLQDLLNILQEIHGAGADLFIHRQALDTTTPSGKALFGMLGVFAEFEREMMRDRINSGLDRAREAGKRLGRPALDESVRNQVLDLRGQGRSFRKIAADLSIGVSSVKRILSSSKSDSRNADDTCAVS
ncbi:recombinase family protein [Desulfonatronum parangueonense]